MFKIGVSYDNWSWLWKIPIYITVAQQLSPINYICQWPFYVFRYGETTIIWRQNQNCNKTPSATFIQAAIIIIWV